ncbi:hypothetical protein ACH5RR_009966 [Cinchona calisaya]|uniref:RNase H type-1 domain-containing protein n=1 Tax=Cinchona calisaya TaxID=153742 RepID=A0ABD3AHA2_9GENT
MNSRYGAGIVTSNEEGKLIFAWAEENLDSKDSLSIEAELIRKAMVKARVNNWKAIHIQSANKLLIEKINNGSIEDVRIVTLLDDILHLKECFDWCSFSFGNSNNMSLATKLARFGRNLTAFVEWKDNFPLWLSEHSQSYV